MIRLETKLILPFAFACFSLFFKTILSFFFTPFPKDTVFFTLWWSVRRRRRLGVDALDGFLLAQRGRDRLRLGGFVGIFSFKWMTE